MTFLTDLFNPTFLMFLGIFILVILLLVVYFESKLREQNHKIASMLSLVSSLAEELNGVKFGLNHLSMRGISGGTMENTFFPPKHLAQNNSVRDENNLIEVSDDDSDDVSDNDTDIDSENSDIISQEDDEDDEDEEDSVFTLIEPVNHNDEKNETKVFKFDNIEETEIGEENFDDNLSVSSKSSRQSIKQFNQIFDTHNDAQENDDNLNDNSLQELKTININLEENSELLDYKKLSLNKLRTIVNEKGLSNDSNKLKKNELLKLLGVE